MSFFRRQARLGWIAGTLFGSALTALAAEAAVPATMQAIRSDAAGGRGAVKLETAEVPTPKEGEVLIRVYAAAANPVDWNNRRPADTAPPPNAAPPPMFRNPGLDAAGVVAAVGAGVTQYKMGDKVMAALQPNGGAFAEYAVALPENMGPKPGKFTYEQAAGVPIAGFTGLRMVYLADIKPGERVLVIGAAGGVGSTALQTAKTRQAHVIADAASVHNAYLKSLEADEIVNYDQTDVAREVHDIDVVLNTVGAENDAAIGYLRRGGRMVSAAGTVNQQACAAAGITCIRVGGPMGHPNDELLKELSRLADTGRYSVKIEKRFPLAQTAQALDFGVGGDREGKIVIDVHPDARRR